MLNAAAEPFLYRCLHTSGKDALYFLIRTLWERPDLRSRVSASEVGHVRGTLPHSLTQPVLDAVLGHMRHAGLLNPPDAWMSANGFGRLGEMREEAEHGALSTMLLHLLPNLESFHLRLPDSGFLWIPP